MKTVEEILRDDRYNMACTYIVNCMGDAEVFTSKDKLLFHWGKENATVYFLNTREVMVNIKY